MLCRKCKERIKHAYLRIITAHGGKAETGQLLPDCIHTFCLTTDLCCCLVCVAYVIESCWSRKWRYPLAKSNFNEIRRSFSVFLSLRVKRKGFRKGLCRSWIAAPFIKRSPCIWLEDVKKTKSNLRQGRNLLIFALIPESQEIYIQIWKIINESLKYRADCHSDYTSD
jgi:hypothetical protein